MDVPRDWAGSLCKLLSKVMCKIPGTFTKGLGFIVLIQYDVTKISPTVGAALTHLAHRYKRKIYPYSRTITW